MNIVLQAVPWQYDYNETNHKTQGGRAHISWNVICDLTWLRQAISNHIPSPNGEHSHEYPTPHHVKLSSILSKSSPIKDNSCVNDSHWNQISFLRVSHFLLREWIMSISSACDTSPKQTSVILGYFHGNYSNAIKILQYQAIITECVIPTGHDPRCNFVLLRISHAAAVHVYGILQLGPPDFSIIRFLIRQNFLLDF